MTVNQLQNLFNLDGRVIVITGAAGLLGQKHAEVVAAYGGIPVLLDMQATAVQNLAVDLANKHDREPLALALDITDESAISRSCQDILDKFGRIDGLVNNAANNPKVEQSDTKNFSRLENFPLEVWQQDIAVGLTGAWLCAKHYGQAIANNPVGGSIVNIASDLGVIAPDQRLYKQSGLADELQPVKPVTYSVVKSGLIGLTRYLATYWADKGVRCNAMCPGGVENNQPEEFLAKVNSRIPMGRLAKKNEYQGTLLWMLSDASSYLNGAIVSVDGGRTTW
ncbi:MAG: SDR family oxidoreductase [Gammaproteobacteria bacterium]|nr:SDR family oxidoreductase [Gammaproteobacteria bacterium]MDH5652077.1 SDR family oxidoreductase [Gammaproteobacteria bacterium]